MPIFKGFEKDENNQPVAVVAYPRAVHYGFVRDAQGTMRKVAEPRPTEERLDEPTFAKRHGVGFEPLKTLPFKEEGYDLNAVIAAQAPDTPNASLGLNIKSEM